MGITDIFKRKAAVEDGAASKNENDPAQAHAPEVPDAGRDSTKEAAMPDDAKTAGSVAKTATTVAPAIPTTPTTPTVLKLADVKAEVETTQASVPNEQAATLAELKAEFPGEPAFVLDCLEKNCTVGAAWKMYGLSQKKRADSLGRLGAAGLAGTDPVGAAPPNAGGAKPAGSNAIEAYDAAVKVTAKEKKISIGAATALVNAEQPELRKAYIEAAEKGRK